MPMPSYAFDTALDTRFGHVYWRNAHDILTKIDAVVQGRLRTLIGHPGCGKPSGASRRGGDAPDHPCGPDDIPVRSRQRGRAADAGALPAAPFLWIQSDGTIAELAHLENRIMTHLRRLEERAVSQETSAPHPLRMEILSEFNLDGLDRARDVVSVATLGDNRVITGLIRAMGFTVDDNYTDESYDLEQKGRMGRQYVGDAVCVPLAALLRT